MSFVSVAPELMTSAATDLATIGSNVSAAHAAAAPPTLAVLPAAADEVSAGIAQVFSQHAASYQAMAGRAAAFQSQFVQNIAAGAGAYAGAESSLANWLQSVELGAESFVSNIDANASIAVGSLLVGTGGYLLGGIGAPGLLPQTAANLFFSIGINPTLIPVAVALLPLVLVYEIETLQIP
ncbi:PE family protein [Mycobacterium parmense]|uniref:Uncharacterized protein n=1 Tax=Mycobacterium parmense TaxID=185642 RepID=A0A7I7YUJ9_9MYCO|nr:PE family protein [Mycobacterium parmense]MCV7348907.1 PE family protein [Mycobacterium parmense]ORW53192.1 hypothetical protein AWC20_20450 [Mycobacterium parmense]BBZ44421.1 hypothetical protein MPRM_17020 [Mycobacterium parmense]